MRQTGKTSISYFTPIKFESSPMLPKWLKRLFSTGNVGNARTPSHPISWQEYDLDEAQQAIAADLASCEDFGIDDDEEDSAFIVNLFDDARSIVGDPAIEALPLALEALEGIEEAVHEDREIIHVRGPITKPELEAFVIAHLARTGDPTWFEFVAHPGAE